MHIRISPEGKAQIEGSLQQADIPSNTKKDERVLRAIALLRPREGRGRRLSESDTLVPTIAISVNPEFREPVAAVDTLRRNVRVFLTQEFPTDQTLLATIKQARVSDAGIVVLSLKDVHATLKAKSDPNR